MRSTKLSQSFTGPGTGEAMTAEGKERNHLDETAEPCWLCARPLGRRVERHHPQPKSRGGRETVPVHPICHRTIHARFSNAELARAPSADKLRADPEIARFLAWVAGKPPDFHAPTRRRR